MSGREVVSWKQNNKSHFWNVHFPQTLFIYSSRFHSLWFGLDHVRRVCSRRISLPFFLFHSTRFWIDWITIVINVFSFQITHKFGKHPKCSWNHKNVYFHKRSFSFLSIRKSKLLWVKNPLATHHHLPRPIQIQGMPVECYAVKKTQNAWKTIYWNIHRTVSVPIVRETAKFFSYHPAFPVVGNVHEVPSVGLGHHHSMLAWSH